MILTFEILIGITLLLAVIAVISYILKARRKIIAYRLQGRNISNRNIVYRIVTRVFIGELPD